MPVPNDLTPEEETAFIEHGVQPAGPGQEPTGEPNQEPAAQEPAGEPPVRDEHGRFAPKAEPAPVPAPVAPVPAAEAPAAAPPPPGFVPHQALHAERMRAQEANRAAQLATARMNALLAAQNANTEPHQMPDAEQDPVGYVRALEQRISAFEQQRQEADQQRQIDNAIEQDEAMFIATTPDYNEAAQHYVQSRAQELLNFYSPEQAQQIMMNEARQMAQEAWKKGQPAAQMVYSMAQARGYRAGAAAPAAQPAPQPLPAPTAQQQVQAVNRGQAATRTLSGGTGSAAPATLNAEALLAMSDEEFADYVKLGTKGANERFAALGGR